MVLLFIEMEKIGEMQDLRVENPLLRISEVSVRHPRGDVKYAALGLCGSQGSRNTFETYTCLSGFLLCFNILQIHLYQCSDKLGVQLSTHNFDLP